MKRFYKLWAILTIKRIKVVYILTILVIFISIFINVIELYRQGHHHGLRQYLFLLPVLLIPYVLSKWPNKSTIKKNRCDADAKPNILMIGCDTLRSDRLGLTGYSRPLSPFIDSLCKQGTFFQNCYTPIARTAPSLYTLLSGLWPTKHGIRDNFVSIEESHIKYKALPEILSIEGYQSIAISDWAGSDFGKLSFGFDHTDVPPDQWNLKYLIRQGSKDIRLFLSLFTHNRFGKIFLPEMYYLSGVPLTTEIGKTARKWLARFARKKKPFFMNVFMATSHPPFGCEYPYYKMFSAENYAGDSKFAMSRLVDPDEIIRSMREPREAFELDQVINLYDACVKRFDDEVERIIEQLTKLGLDKNTIIVLYSDHGMELFEHNTWGQGNCAEGEASPRVPLVIINPSLPGNGIDKRVVRTVDVMPTLLEMCDISLPDHIDGMSLVPYIKDQSLEWELPAYFETGIWLAKPPGQDDTHLSYPDIRNMLFVPDKTHGTLAIQEKYKDIVIKARDRMIRKGRWKLVRYPMKNEEIIKLFDLEKDPQCRMDVSRLHPEVVKGLRSELQSWLDADGIE
jgi:arylsulfatase A-like enzyme